MKPVVIAGAARTPMGGFQGALSDMPAAKLGGMVLCDEETHDATRDDIRFVRRTPHPNPASTHTLTAHSPEPHTSSTPSPTRALILALTATPTPKALPHP